MHFRTFYLQEHGLIKNIKNPLMVLLILIVITAYSVSFIGDVCVSAAITGEVWTSKTPGGPAEIFFNPNEIVYINWFTNSVNSKSDNKHC